MSAEPLDASFGQTANAYPAQNTAVERRVTRPTLAPSQPFDRWLLAVVQRSLGDAPIGLALWDGRSAYAGTKPPVASLVFSNRRALVGVALDPQLQFGEAYMDGRLELQGDLVACLEAIYRGPGPRALAAVIERMRALRRESNTLRRSRHNIHHHYDIGNDFYRLWLDRELVYTCAYFPSPDLTLEEAQRAKMDYVCRKLRLQPGERVVETGCGWGALALHMARHYGVSVRAFNISREQVRYARRRADEEGLSDRVEFVEDDYRNVTSRCDVFVSIGMLEHVGRPDYRTMGALIHRNLDSRHGRGLLHFIGRNRPQPLSAWIRKRIFPGGYPPTLTEVASSILEPWKLSVLDVENLRLHYARTLQHWLGRFEEAAGQVAAMFDERFVRAWRLYLAGSQAAFTTGGLQLFQVVFARPTDNDVPWTRAELYRGSDAAGSSCRST